MIDLETLKTAIPIRFALEHYGLSFNRGGFARCPFHPDGTPSLKIYEKTNSWYCFGCCIGGDLITFVQLMFNYTFSEAVQKLQEDFGISGCKVTELTPKTLSKKEIFDNRLDELIKQKNYWESICAKEPEFNGIDTVISDEFANALNELDLVKAQIEELFY